MSTKDEMWLPIRGFSEYEISSRGRVRKIETKKLMAIYRSTGLFVILYSNGKQYTKIVARLVADAFIRKLKKQERVVHIDNDWTNNNLYNLRIVESNSAQNEFHHERKHRTKTVKNLNQFSEQTNARSRRVSSYKNGELIASYQSAAKASIALTGKIHGSTSILRCCKREQKYQTAYGYEWKFE